MVIVISHFIEIQVQICFLEADEVKKNGLIIVIAYIFCSVDLIDSPMKLAHKKQ